ncbi:MAG TPA: glycosyltransferase [Terriglobales bacterium]|nr:glycosyltransferase [Terriglobales bacterium]
MSVPGLSHCLTVVIPTYNRHEILRRTLHGYLDQSAVELLRELLVVDDGSTDDTRSVVAEIQRVAPFPVQYIYQPNRGPAAARNNGIRQVKTWLLLLTDDDMVPDRNVVRAHVQRHEQHPQSSTAVLGLVKWAAELNPTPFMKWYAEAGPLFAYGHFKKRRELDFWNFYSCNLSLKTEFLNAGGTFNEAFKSAAYEDTDLGFRLSKAGLRLLYEPSALTYHYQYFTFADACNKTRRSSAARFFFFATEAGRKYLEMRSHPRSSCFRTIGKQIAAWLARPAACLVDSQVPLPSIVYRTLFWYHTRDHAPASTGYEFVTTK